MKKKNFLKAQYSAEGNRLFYVLQDELISCTCQFINFSNQTIIKGDEGFCVN